MCYFFTKKCYLLELLAQKKSSQWIFFFFRVPTEDPSGQSIVLPRYEFHRIVNCAQTLTKEQRLAQLEQIKREKEAAMVN